jgi:phosphate/sulfate permease
MPAFDLRNSGHALERNLLAMEMEVWLAVESLEFGSSIIIVLVLSPLFSFAVYVHTYRIYQYSTKERNRQQEGQSAVSEIDVSMRASAG